MEWAQGHRHLDECTVGFLNCNANTAWFPIEQSTRQGCNISPTEFNLYAERIMRTVEENYEGVVISGRRITNLRYADDTTLLARTQERIKKFFKDLVQESACYNMYINAQKSKIMVVSRQDNISVQVDHEGESLEQVHVSCIMC